MRADQEMKGWGGALVQFPSGLVVECTLARTDKERETGFIGKRRPAYGTGILFVFERLVTTPFTMAETPFPLDIVFLRASSVSGKMVTASIMGEARSLAFSPDLIMPSMPYDLVVETAHHSPLHGMTRSDVLIKKRE